MRSRADEARDVAQDIFVRVYERLDGYDGSSAFIAWLLRVSRNVCIDRLRRRSARPPASDLVLDDGVARAVAGGARGYLVKDATREELTATLSYALAEATWRRAPRHKQPTDMGTPPALTERELQVLTGMSRGRSNAEIGRELYLSEDTVKTHARRLFRKVGAADRAQAVALGFRWGLVR